MAPVRNHGRVSTPAPSIANHSEFDFGLPPPFISQQLPRQLIAPPILPAFSSFPSQYAPRSGSPTFSSSSPATSQSSALTPSPLPSPHIPQHHIPNHRYSPVPRKRISHSRSKSPDHVPRPPNPFIVFRSAFWLQEKEKGSSVKDHRVISRMAGQAWNKMTPEEQAPYRRTAHEAKRRHQEEHPDYRYIPSSRKSPSSKKEAVSRTMEQDNARHRAMAEFIMGGLRGDELKAAIQQLDEGSEHPLVSVPLSSVPSSSTSAPPFDPASLNFPSLLAFEQVSPLSTLPNIFQEVLPSSDCFPSSSTAMEPENSAFFSPIEMQPRFAQPLLSDAPCSSSTSPDATTSDPPLTDEAAIVLYNLLSNGNPSFCDSFNDFVPQSLPEQPPADSLFAVFQEVDQSAGYQGALGLYPNFESENAEPAFTEGTPSGQSPSGTGDASLIAQVDELIEWLNASQFEC
ncbi:hypothetical protein EIP91_011504 [Steccherinum ochraceum]|uniref:HMG box domain-containing protein n=1 Tax=Steccherinum ochraceum TaxID=92696 RepID=A0A4R0RW21_9APHY|nr:hypothetical protein EIP91_011504 [Steccherinum ochraceum]